MPDINNLERRVSALEDDVSDLYTRDRDTRNIGLDADERARAAQEAHRQNVRMLNAIRETQAEHSRRLGAVEQRLGAVEQRLDAVEQRLDAIEEKLGGMMVMMHEMHRILTRLAEDAGFGDDDQNGKAGAGTP